MRRPPLIAVLSWPLLWAVAWALLGASLPRAAPGAGDAPQAEPRDDPRVVPEGLAEMRDYARRLIDAGHYEDAVAAYIAIAEHAPGDPRAHYEVAGTMAFLRMYPQLVPRIERAIALDPDNALYLELAAMTYAHLGRHREAFEATLRGARLGDTKAMYSLAGLYEKGRGTPASGADALRWLERAARAGHMGAMDAMARVYRDGRYGQAPDAARARAWREMLRRAMDR